jgi:Uma2 family endonuclease
MALTQKLMTADELWRLPDDGQRHELIAGELRTMAPSGAEHGDIELAIAAPLRQHVLAHRLGRVFGAETGFRLAINPDMVRAPDAAFVTRERAAAVGRVTGYWPGAPDLAVEVISPNDLYTDVDEKVATWLEHGTRMVIVVNPRRRAVAVHRSPTQVRHLTEADTLDGEEVVPGWSMPVRDLFAMNE